MTEHMRKGLELIYSGNHYKLKDMYISPHAKLLALERHVCVEPQHDNFASPTPTCRYPKCQHMALGTKREPVEYTLRLAISCWLCDGHVDFLSSHVG